MVDPDDFHVTGFVVHDGFRVFAEYSGDTAQADAETERVRLADLGNPDVRIWPQRICGWTNTRLRGEPLHIEALDVGWHTMSELRRRLEGIASIHRPEGKTCTVCKEPFPCRTRILTDTSIENP